MSDIFSAFNRALLKEVHREVKALYPQVDLRSALAAIKSASGQWFVEGSVAGKRIQWQGRAEDAAHAKYKAWIDHLKKVRGEVS